MARDRKKRRTSYRRIVSFALFLVTAAVLFVGRHEVLWGIQGYLLDHIDFFRIESEADLVRLSGTRGHPAEVVGIPDYKNMVRFPYEKKILTCYRMVGFENRLFVCKWNGLARPKAIDEIIQNRTVRGKLGGLNRSPLEDRLRRVFLRAGNIGVAEDAFLLLEDRRPLPSVLEVGFLSLCLILCCFFAYRVIK